MVPTPPPSRLYGLQQAHQEDLGKAADAYDRYREIFDRTHPKSTGSDSDPKALLDLLRSSKRIRTTSPPTTTSIRANSRGMPTSSSAEMLDSVARLRALVKAAECFSPEENSDRVARLQLLVRKDDISDSPGSDPGIDAAKDPPHLSSFQSDSPPFPIEKSLAEWFHKSEKFSTSLIKEDQIAEGSHSAVFSVKEQRALDMKMVVKCIKRGSNEPEVSWFKRCNDLCREAYTIEQLAHFGVPNITHFCGLFVNGSQEFGILLDKFEIYCFEKPTVFTRSEYSLSQYKRELYPQDHAAYKRALNEQKAATEQEEIEKSLESLFKRALNEQKAATEQEEIEKSLESLFLWMTEPEVTDRPKLSEVSSKLQAFIEKAARESPEMIEELNRLNLLIGTVEKMHKAGYFHRDIKPSNLLLTSEENPTFKLTDFGSAAKISENKELRKVTGSPMYRGPEFDQFFKDKKPKFTRASEVFSLGATFFKTVFGSDLYDEIEKGYTPFQDPSDHLPPEKSFRRRSSCVPTTNCNLPERTSVRRPSSC